MLKLLIGGLGPRILFDPTAYNLTSLITDVTSMVTALVGWLSTIFTTALTSPIVVAFIVMAIIGVAVRFAKKLMHV